MKPLRILYRVLLEPHILWCTVYNGNVTQMHKCVRCQRGCMDSGWCHLGSWVLCYGAYFVWWRLLFVDPQNGTCFMSAFWHLEFWGGFCIFRVSVHPLVWVTVLVLCTEVLQLCTVKIFDNYTTSWIPLILWLPGDVKKDLHVCYSCLCIIDS